MTTIEMIRKSARYSQALVLAAGEVTRKPDAITVTEDATVTFELAAIDDGDAVEITVAILQGQPVLYSPRAIVSVSAGNVVGLYF